MRVLSRSLAPLAVALVLGIFTAGCTPAGGAVVLDLLAARAQAGPSFVNPALGGLPVYGASQCVGPVIMGVCQGAVIGVPAARCYGAMLNGQCTGRCSRMDVQDTYPVKSPDEAHGDPRTLAARQDPRA
jgi:hypothetical protein